MIPILLYILYKKKGKDISRAAKKVIGKAKTKRLLRKAERMERDQDIKGEIKKPFQIDQKLCIKCGACIATCKFSAIVKK